MQNYYEIKLLKQIILIRILWANFLHRNRNEASIRGGGGFDWGTHSQQLNPSDIDLAVIQMQMKLHKIYLFDDIYKDTRCIEYYVKNFSLFFCEFMSLNEYKQKL